MNEASKSPSSPGDPAPSDAAGGSKKSWLVTGLLLAFCWWHTGFLVYSIKPPPPTKPGKEVPSDPTLDFYRLAISGAQEWDLFVTIPILHSMDARLVGRDERGNEVTAGCVLPELTPYPKPELSRYYAGFFRLLSNDRYLDPYLRKMANLLRARQGPKDNRRWSLVVDAEHLRELAHVKRDGRWTAHGTKAFPLPNPSADPP